MIYSLGKSIAEAWNLRKDWLDITYITVTDNLDFDVRFLYGGSEGFARYSLTKKAWIDITDEVQEAQAAAVDAYLASL